MTNKGITSVHMAGGYGGKVVINAYNFVGEILKIEADDLCEFLTQYLKEHEYETTLKPQQKYHRIILCQNTK